MEIMLVITTHFAIRINTYTPTVYLKFHGDKETAQSQLGYGFRGIDKVKVNPIYGMYIEGRAQLQLEYDQRGGLMSSDGQGECYEYDETRAQQWVVSVQREESAT